MEPKQQLLTVQIVRFVDGRFPGWVECDFVDANSVRHSIVDKYPLFTTEMLDATSAYPQLGKAPCEVLERWRDSQGRDLARITLARPGGMESKEGVSEFVVEATQLSP
jgi:hypothetical protein